MSVLDFPTTEIEFGRWSNGMVLSAEEYDAATEWDDRYRYELINGVLIVSPPAGIGERGPNDYLGHWIWNYKEMHPQGQIVIYTAPEQEIRIGRNRRRADRAIWIGSARSIDPLADVPTIAVEFVSNKPRDRKRDFVVKRAEYASAGVKEYWVIDRFARELTVFRGMDEVLTIAENEIYTTPLLPGFELPFAKLLAKADQYKSVEESEE
ncbi:Uma2 family endonuclease [Aeoliella sp. SH292]|uniref:Uma2 family endonuclease n=1 Tax=Aeoliella sp. SH292 TaxID=3454464 RepID=UPI003F9905DC